MFLFNHVELFGGVVKFTPIIEMILIICVCHFIYDWRKDYRSTGWKLNVWHLEIMMSFGIPYFIIYPFCSSPFNFISVGTDYLKIEDYVDKACLITLLGYLAFLFGGWIAKYKKYDFDKYRFFEKIIYTNITKGFGLYVFTIFIVAFWGVAAVMSIQSGMLFNARGVFLLNPSIRMVGNFFASITPIIMTFYLVRYFDKSIIKKKKLDLILIFCVSVLCVFWGSRALLFGIALKAFLYYVYLNQNISFKSIFISGFVAILGVMSLAVLRLGAIDVFYSSNIEIIFSALFGGIVYGNTFSDCRDFAWMLSGFDGNYLFGSTYISGFTSFLPSYFFPFRREFAMGVISLDLAGLDNVTGEHPGLRGAPFFEIFFNFSYLGVVIWGIVLGFITRYSDLAMRYSVNNNSNVTVGYIKSIYPMLIGGLGITAGMFSLYVFLGAVFLLIWINVAWSAFFKRKLY